MSLPCFDDTCLEATPDLHVTLNQAPHQIQLAFLAGLPEHS